MDSKDVRDYIIEFQRSSPPSMVRREIQIKPRVTLINTIIGPRRAGKTYFLHQLMQPLDASCVLYLNFEDTRLMSVTFKDFVGIVNLHTEVTGKEPEYVFFDEPQNIDFWERGVRTLFDARKFKIIITGSSSKLLGSEVATHLRGRAITHLLLPYSFREFLSSRAAEVPKAVGSADAAVLKNHLGLWLEFGGYPEVVKSADKVEKMKILDSYKDLIIYKDVIERHGAKEPFLIKLLIDHMIASFAKEFSINGFFNTLKSRNISVSKKTLYEYLSFIEDSVSVFVLDKWSPKIKEQRLAPKKSYLCDNGLAHRQADLSRRMENAVFLELKRRQGVNPGLGIYFWKDYKQKEVDFVVREGQKTIELIQVTYAESRSDVKKRETDNILAAGKELRCSKLRIITWDYEGTEMLGGKKVFFIPLWKWVLQPEQPGQAGFGYR